MADDAHFSPRIFEFLSDLRDNNSRDWFNANKKRYESDVKEPLLRFVEDFDERIEAVSAHFIADPRPVGGSMFRIYRDVRFSRDKTPYKTNAGLHFRHEIG
ncbi:MAG: TIGR02453 family protein, partial [Chloroflexi bacterium]|nr:TIGR02453 family protein [Chloroflexota bacterium]